MPVEFALRPRIRLREGFAPPKRRWRLRLPRFTPHVLAYWAVIGGICYAVVRAHDSAATDSAADQPLATEQPLAAEPPLTAELRGAAAQPATAAPSTAEPADPVEPLPTPADPEPAEQARESLSVPASVPAPFVDSRPEARPAVTEAAPTAGSAPAAEPELERSNVATPSSLAHAGAREDSALPSCESAAASAVQDSDFASSDRTADLSSSAIAGVLENGVWLSTCNVPASTHLGVCVAIKHGHVTAATVIARPADRAIEACVKTRAAALQFPYSNRQDIARTQF